MKRKICKHGEQLKLKGGGIYFLCRFEWERKNSQCQFVKWCIPDKKYYASVDKGGNMCPYFEPSITTEQVYTETVDDLEVLDGENDTEVLDIFRELFSE